MKVCFRTDASIQTGSGHVMRCLALAGALWKNGAQVSFVCRDLPGNGCDFIEADGFEVFHLPDDNDVGDDGDAWLTAEYLARCRPDWLIVDHYRIDAKWERQQRPLVGRILVIDDLADRSHDCDILLDQNLHEQMENRYVGLVPDGCRKLLGPRFALLRAEFGEARKALNMRDGFVRRVMVSFGGSDPTNETEKALLAFSSLNREDVKMDVIVGAASPNRERLLEICRKMLNVECRCNVREISKIMASADLAIGGGGTTTWERCCLSLPTLLIAVADNQIDIARAISKAGAAVFLGTSRTVSQDHIKQSLYGLLNAPSRLRQLAETAGDLVDGAGAVRVSEKILSSYGECPR